MDGGHPPTNGIASALIFFFINAGVLGDIESYHLFEMLFSFLLISEFFSFLLIKNLELLLRLFSGVSLAAYPLFFSESHFNIKDPVGGFIFWFNYYLILFWCSQAETNLDF